MATTRISLSLNTKIYPEEAVLASCYCFLDKLYVFLENPKKNTITVHLTSKDNKDITKMKGEFQNELVNNVLRYNIAQRNKDLRQYIVKTALFFSQPKETIDELLFDDLNLEGGQDNWQEDPLDIAVPWEEKYDKE
jgi:His-Xaa-Ser system protein HxsD